MSNWVKTDDGMEATIDGRNYLIVKDGTGYRVYFGEPPEYIAGPYPSLVIAQTVAEIHEPIDDAPTPTKPGIHIDDIAGQQLIDILKRSFTTARIQDFIDASPYDEPDTGAPEAMG